VTIRVLLADDQELVRAGFRMILQLQPDIEIVGEAADGAEAVALTVSGRPDVVLMDVQMPLVDGLAATRVVVSRTDARVVILTTFDRDDYLFESLRAGASGFLLKNAPGRRPSPGDGRLGTAGGRRRPGGARGARPPGRHRREPARDDRRAHRRRRRHRGRRTADRRRRRRCGPG
jgi:chemotaxis response regulator CheB